MCTMHVFQNTLCIKMKYFFAFLYAVQDIKAALCKTECVSFQKIILCFSPQTVVEIMILP